MESIFAFLSRAVQYYGVGRLIWGSVVFQYDIFCLLCILKQRMLSRQEELKERARVLLEQARKDAALKAGNRQFSSSIVPGRSKQLTDVRNVHYCDLYRSVFAFICVSGCGNVFLVSDTVAGCNTPEQQNMEKQQRIIYG